MKRKFYQEYFRNTRFLPFPSRKLFSDKYGWNNEWGIHNRWLAMQLEVHHRWYIWYPLWWKGGQFFFPCLSLSLFAKTLLDRYFRIHRCFWIEEKVINSETSMLKTIRNWIFLSRQGRRERETTRIKAGRISEFWELNLNSLTWIVDFAALDV